MFLTFDHRILIFCLIQVKDFAKCGDVPLRHLCCFYDKYLINKYLLNPVSFVAWWTDRVGLPQPLLLCSLSYSERQGCNYSVGKEVGFKVQDCESASPLKFSFPPLFHSVQNVFFCFLLNYKKMAENTLFEDKLSLARKSKGSPGNLQEAPNQCWSYVHDVSPTFKLWLDIDKKPAVIQSQSHGVKIA